MGWFSFGKHKQHNDKSQQDEQKVIQRDDQELDSQDPQQSIKSHMAVSPENESTQSSTERHNITVAGTYHDRGVSVGPWDTNDEDVPNYDEYLSLGAMYLPYLEGIGLQLKVNQEEQTVLAATINYGDSSLELEAFAAPKTLGLWDDVRQDLLNSHTQAYEQEGTFGMELMLPVQLKSGKTVITRMVGVDGPRWMLRGIFSGSAAQGKGKAYVALNKYFADIVVERGEEPLAPRDLIPMTAPVPPSERKAKDGDDADSTDMEDTLKRSKGPLSYDQQTQVKTTLARGPMFSELR